MVGGQLAGERARRGRVDSARRQHLALVPLARRRVLAPLHNAHGGDCDNLAVGNDAPHRSIVPVREEPVVKAV